MKAVMSEVPPHILQWRKHTGADIWDEMWEGVLHMTPAPNIEHQHFQWALTTWLAQNWARPNGNTVYSQVNVAAVGGWPNDYRIPDVVLLTPDRFHINRKEYLEGPPLVVVEIRSPGDESMEKVPFYARIGVPEAWIIDRDTKAPTIYVLRGGNCEEVAAAADGWLHSAATGIRLRGEGGNKLALQMADDQSTRRLLPED